MPGLDDGQGFELVRLFKRHEKDQKGTAFINIPYDWLGLDVNSPDFLRSLNVAHLVCVYTKNPGELFGPPGVN